ncbi:hypothetical protein P3748_16940 [Vibrio parahaemolyticus]|nr:hypothetical protein [Vibrio parahaemolyticus]MDF5038164.1 hypothetical protein [Vibrio parahaemolyticus]MDF5686908.1 hypothetical protein [Vibrio parahaemolyticus]
MTRYCKATLKTGSRKGEQCQLAAKYKGYCGIHKHLRHQANNLEKSVQIITCTTGLIAIAEKIMEHLPTVITTATGLMGSMNINFYPEFGRDGLPVDRSEFFKITSSNPVVVRKRRLIKELKSNLKHCSELSKKVDSLYRFIEKYAEDDQKKSATLLYKQYKELCSYRHKGT